MDVPDEDVPPDGGDGQVLVEVVDEDAGAGVVQLHIAHAPGQKQTTN